MDWRALFRPSTRFSIATLVIGGIAVGVVGYFVSQQVLHATSTDEFCMSCHSGHAHDEEVLATAHGNNSSGIVVECQQCHLPQEPINYLIAKIKVSTDVFTYLATPDFSTTEWQEANRARLSEMAREDIRGMNSSTCRNCHVRVYEFQPEAMSQMAAGMHTMNASRPESERQQCVDCHTGIAHPYPSEAAD